MNFSNLSMTHIAAVAVLNFLLGALWYSRLLFVKPWMRGLGKDPSQPASEAQKREVPRLLGLAFLSALAMSLGMAALVQGLPQRSPLEGATLGALLGLLLLLPQGLGTAFEGRKAVVIIINSGHGLAVLILDGAIHAAWG